MSRPIVEAVCIKTGHKLQSFIVKDVVDPISKAVIHQYEVRCEKCSLTVEEIRRFRRLPKKERQEL